MGIWLGALEGLDQAFNGGRASQWVGDKANQFMHWAGDMTGANGAKPVTPGHQIDYGQMQEDRDRQAALYQQFQAMSQGNGPSLAQGQLQQATDQNIRQAMALGQAQQGQGLGYASALRNIADQSAAARQQAAGQSALIRNQEQMQGMQGMGALGGQMFGQDLARQQLGSGNAYQYDALNANIDAQNAAGRRQLTGGLLNAGGALGSMAMGGMAHGGAVPGYAAGGALDSKANDTVPAMLSPGEIVLPRSITMAPDAAERARVFVEEVRRRRQNGSPSMEHHLVRQAGRKAKMESVPRGPLREGRTLDVYGQMQLGGFA